MLQILGLGNERHRVPLTTDQWHKLFRPHSVCLANVPPVRTPLCY